MRTDLPSGTVTFLFTDIEGSTELLHELGPEAYARALAEHRGILRAAFTRHSGVEVDTQGDAFFVAFPTAPGALAAVEEILEGLAATPIRVRMGLHTGTPFVAEEGYVGPDVNRAARIAAAGQGGQVLVSASTAALVGIDRLRDLGEHRLKDLSAPERIYQLGEGEFPPLASLHQTNLPLAATPFVGRERELAEVSALLAREDVRLVTLTGPGGTGKTRLALQAAGAAADAFPAGVWWVPLAPLHDPALVLETAAHTLGAKNGLAEHVADKRLLLLLDNFEHLVAAADELAGLLGVCPRLQVVVTSRELLQLPGEQAYPVPPLAPDEGSELFFARARAVDPDFQGDGCVAELCEQLDQLPLALELAAARVRLLSPAQLVERLPARLDLLKAGRAVDPRQQTLRATIEWSHELLTAGEQQLFRRLSVFSGGCTVEAAEEICDADLDTLQSLVDKSLVRMREGERFWMLETIREYAVERLEASAEADAFRGRHAEHFLTLAEAAEPNVRAGRQDWVERVEAEHANARVALDFFKASNETALTLRLAGALARFWYVNGHLEEGRRRLDRALAADDRWSPARGKALNGVAVLAVESGDVTTGRLRAEEALEFHRAIGDERGTADSLFILAHAVSEEGDLSRAQELFEESRRRFRELDDERFTQIATHNVAWMSHCRGDTRRARELYEANLAFARAAGDEALETVSLELLALIAVEEGRLHDALTMLTRTQRMNRAIGNRRGLAYDLDYFAAALASGGRADAAARLLSKSEALRAEIGARARPTDARLNERTLDAIRAQLGDAAFEEAWEQGRVMKLDDAITLALGEAG